MSSNSENIQNAFTVVYKTLESVKKLMEYCDKIAYENGYTSSSSKFLRNNTDNDIEGWLYRKFFKVYQSNECDEEFKNGWKKGPLYVLEINLEKKPIYYISKFEYEDTSKFKGPLSAADWWAFYYPTDINNNRFIFKELEERYIESRPTEKYKKNYWGLEKVIFIEKDLMELKRENIEINIFKEFDKLDYLKI